MNNSITIGVIMLMLASGFIIISYDKADGGVKLMSEDDYEKIDKGNGYDTLTKEEIAEMEIRTTEVISEKSLEEQLEELGEIEIKLYGKEISDFDAMRNK